VTFFPSLPDFWSDRTGLKVCPGEIGIKPGVSYFNSRRNDGVVRALFSYFERIDLIPRIVWGIKPMKEMVQSKLST
jgi:hypothetical protein